MAAATHGPLGRSCPTSPHFSPASPSVAIATASQHLPASRRRLVANFHFERSTALPPIHHPLLLLLLLTDAILPRFRLDAVHCVHELRLRLSSAAELSHEAWLHIHLTSSSCSPSQRTPCTGPTLPATTTSERSRVFSLSPRSAEQNHLDRQLPDLTFDLRPLTGIATPRQLLLTRAEQSRARA